MRATTLLIPPLLIAACTSAAPNTHETADAIGPEKARQDFSYETEPPEGEHPDGEHPDGERAREDHSDHDGADLDGAADRLSAVTWMTALPVGSACAKRPVGALIAEFDTTNAGPVIARCDSMATGYCGPVGLRNELVTDYLRCHEYALTGLPSIAPLGAPDASALCATITNGVLGQDNLHDLAVGAPLVATDPPQQNVFDGVVDIVFANLTGTARMIDYTRWTARVEATPGTRELVVTISGDLELSAASGGFSYSPADVDDASGTPVRFSYAGSESRFGLTYHVTFDETAPTAREATTWALTDLVLFGVDSVTIASTDGGFVDPITQSLADNVFEDAVRDTIKLYASGSQESLARFFGDFVFVTNRMVRHTPQRDWRILALDAVEAPPEWDEADWSQCAGPERLGMSVVVSPADPGMPDDGTIGLGYMRTVRLDDSLAGAIGNSIDLSSWDPAGTLKMTLPGDINFGEEPDEVASPEGLADVADYLDELISGIISWQYPLPGVTTNCPAIRADALAFCNAGGGSDCAAYASFVGDTCTLGGERKWAIEANRIELDPPPPFSICGYVERLTTNTSANALSPRQRFEQDQQTGEINLVLEDRVNASVRAQARLRILAIDSPRCPTIPQDGPLDTVPLRLADAGFIAVDVTVAGSARLNLPLALTTSIPLSSERMVSWDDEQHRMEGWLSEEQWLRWSADSTGLEPSQLLFPQPEDGGFLDGRRTDMSVELEFDPRDLIDLAEFGDWTATIVSPLPIAPLDALGMVLQTSTSLLSPITISVGAVSWAVLPGPVIDLLMGQVNTELDIHFDELVEAVRLSLGNTQQGWWPCTALSPFEMFHPLCPNSSPPGMSGVVAGTVAAAGFPPELIIGMRLRANDPLFSGVSGATLGGAPNRMVYATQQTAEAVGVRHITWSRRLATLRSVLNPTCNTLAGGTGWTFQCPDDAPLPKLMIEAQVAPYPDRSNAAGFLWIFEPTNDPEGWLPGRP